jgi:hypothetical protein
MTRCLRKFSTPLREMYRPINFVGHSINSKAAFFILKAGAVHVKEGGKLITIVTSLLAAFTGFYTRTLVLKRQWSISRAGYPRNCRARE